MQKKSKTHKEKKYNFNRPREKIKEDVKNIKSKEIEDAQMGEKNLKQTYFA